MAAPLWNKQYSSATYTKYDSASIQATIDGNPGGSSKLCLSCHDGTLAIGQVNVIDGSVNQTIAMQGVQGDGSMPLAIDGYTRNLGTDLSNDHPISLVYDSVLAGADGELYDPSNDVAGQGAQVGIRGGSGVADQPRFILEGAAEAIAKMQCTTCHDPHLAGLAEDADTNSNTDTKIKFLRANRFQRVTEPTEGLFNEDNDILCLACHDKAGWADSAHARGDVADERYENSAANLREFPIDMEVWEAGCLNCHDTHSQQGSRRLLRQGSTGSSQASSAIEETCYQCHQPKGGSNALQDTIGYDVPDIRSDFTSAYRMPITTVDQEDATQEVHEITDKDFSESTAKLAVRHVECTDCHNPHRLKKTQRIDSYQVASPDAEPTHAHVSGHTNIASGVLTGTYGVEPRYSSTIFSPESTTIDTITFKVKKGMPSGAVVDSIDPDSYGFVTREYQVCMKCHSNNAFGIVPPSLNSSGNGGSGGVNGVTEVTNQAMEFQAPAGHVGEGTGTGTPANWGVVSGSVANNHRSWHPVMKPTGRTDLVRNASANQWLSPWNGAVGTQTMYCSDCHGSNTANGTSAPDNKGTPADPTDDAPWGPHGSINPFILKGDWNVSVTPTPVDALCFRCHDTNYRSGKGDTTSGFNDNGDRGDLHDYHVDKIGTLKCTWCHVALPHGWKNKAFLVNINDIGPECAGHTVGEGLVSITPEEGFTCAPYYQNAFARINSFQKSGEWTDASCAGKDYMRDNCSNPN
ncbi:MAG: cytochrome c3 family protein [Motiliproteus sp.]